tara:strand:+ start:1304 stop:1477 length:174 start_codon:yes stop_codon:yes gene_type:complete
MNCLIAAPVLTMSASNKKGTLTTNVTNMTTNAQTTSGIVKRISIPNVRIKYSIELSF